MLPAAAGEPHIAGTAPDRRPHGAPVATATVGYGGDAVLRGIEMPVPPTLRFIEHHGGWYTPMARPGMTAPYDIRGLHGVAR